MRHAEKLHSQPGIATVSEKVRHCVKMEKEARVFCGGNAAK